MKLRIQITLLTLCTLFFIGFSGCRTEDASKGEYDIVIYGGTSSGGLTTGGLGQTDIGNKQAIGGISREFYHNVRVYYENPDHWIWQERSDYQDGGQTRTDVSETTMWTFEPSAALSVYHQILEDENIEIRYNLRLNRETANEQYGESLNGVQANDTSLSLLGKVSANGRNHNFVDGVDPYIIAGDKARGVLPFIDVDGPGQEGEVDHRLQAYCFRMCITDHPRNMIPFSKPDGNSKMPNRKTDTNNRTGFSTDFIVRHRNDQQRLQ